MEVILAVAGTLFIVWGASAVLRPAREATPVACVLRFERSVEPSYAPPGDMRRSAVRLDRAGLERNEIAGILGLDQAEVEMMLNHQPRWLDGQG